MLPSSFRGLRAAHPAAAATQSDAGSQDQRCVSPHASLVLLLPCSRERRPGEHIGMRRLALTRGMACVVARQRPGAGRRSYGRAGLLRVPIVVASATAADTYTSSCAASDRAVHACSSTTKLRPQPLDGLSAQRRAVTEQPPQRQLEVALRAPVQVQRVRPSRKAAYTPYRGKGSST